MDQLLGYIKTLQMEGSVLVFLPGWNTISGLMKHFKACFQIRHLKYPLLIGQHPIFRLTIKQYLKPAESNRQYTEILQNS